MEEEDFSQYKCDYDGRTHAPQAAPKVELSTRQPTRRLCKRLIVRPLLGVDGLMSLLGEVMWPDMPKRLRRRMAPSMACARLRPHLPSTVQAARRARAFTRRASARVSRARRHFQGRACRYRAHMHHLPDSGRLW